MTYAAWCLDLPARSGSRGATGGSRAHARHRRLALIALRCRRTHKGAALSAGGHAAASGRPGGMSARPRRPAGLRSRPTRSRRCPCRCPPSSRRRCPLPCACARFCAARTPRARSATSCGCWTGRWSWCSTQMSRRWVGDAVVSRPSAGQQLQVKPPGAKPPGVARVRAGCQAPGRARWEAAARHDVVRPLQRIRQHGSVPSPAFCPPPPPPHTHPRRTTWIRCRIAPRRSGTLLMSRTTRPRQTGAPWQVRHQSLPCAGLATGRSGACSTCDEMHARMEACELAGRAPGRYPGTSAAFNGQAHLWRHMHAQGCVRGHHARARGRRGARPQRDRICVRRDRQRQDVLHGW